MARRSQLTQNNDQRLRRLAFLLHAGVGFALGHFDVRRRRSDCRRGRRAAFVRGVALQFQTDLHAFRWK